MASSWIQEAEENAKRYADAIKQQSQYLIDQQNQFKQSSLQANENDRINAINQLNQGKDVARQTALDNARQANINRMLALRDNQNAMSRAGLSTQGVVGSQVNSINNNYGTNLNDILRTRANQLQDIDNQVNSTNREYDTNRLNLTNQYEQNIASLNSQIDQQALQQYNTIYQSYLNQKQQEAERERAELERQEAIRQFNLQLEYQKQQDAIKNAQTWAQINNNNSKNKNPNFTDDEIDEDNISDQAKLIIKYENALLKPLRTKTSKTNWLNNLYKTGKINDNDLRYLIKYWGLE